MEAAERKKNDDAKAANGPISHPEGASPPYTDPYTVLYTVPYYLTRVSLFILESLR